MAKLEYRATVGFRSGLHLGRFLALGALFAGCGAIANDDDGASVDLTEGAVSHSEEALGSASQGSLQRQVLALEDAYTRWYYGDLSLPLDANGNAVFGGVVLVGIPDAPGDGTPGSLDVKLKASQSFFLPLYGLFGTSYTDGTPPDPFEPISIFKTLKISFKVDGQTVVDSRNVIRFFSKFSIDPPIPLDPPYAGIIWGEDVSVLHRPLSRGAHTLKLDVKNTEPAFGGFLEYHNTWHVTVVR